MAYDYSTLHNMIIRDLRENLKISPNQLADIIEYLAQLAIGGELYGEYGGVITTSSSDPSVLDHIMFAIASGAGNYTNLRGFPSVLGSFALIHFDGLEWQTFEMFQEPNVYTFQNQNIINISHNLHKNVDFTVEAVIDDITGEYEPVVPHLVRRRDNDMDIEVYPKMNLRVVVYP